MEPQYQTLEAMLHCPYKAWLLLKREITAQIELPGIGLNPIPVSPWQISRSQNAASQEQITKTPKNHKLATQLLADTEKLLSKNAPPPFYKIPHCSACQFKNECHNKLKEKDCISLLQ